MTTSSTAEPSDFELYLRTGRRMAGPLQVKFNPNHDPADGRFTWASGGGAGGGHVAAGRRIAAAQPAQDTPFRRAAKRNDATGKMAREVNAFMHGQSNSMVLPLGGGDGSLTVTRQAGSRVTLSHFGFAADGVISNALGHESVDIKIVNPKMRMLFSSINSFPSQLKIYQGSDGSINYSMDKDIDVRLAGVPLTRKRGSYIFIEKGK